MVSFRYLVKDVDGAVSFYTQCLGFTLQKQFGEAMAIVAYDGFTVWLAGPESSAAKAMPDGQKPAPGGWNRFILEVNDLNALVNKLKAQGVPFRNEIVKGPGGQQILCEDPSGNVIELFQVA
jgi:predicted enzyme related to lactoylglutathione lyase